MKIGKFGATTYVDGSDAGLRDNQERSKEALKEIINFNNCQVCVANIANNA